MTTNSQFLDAMLGGVTPYRIDAADGAITGKTYDALYVSTVATLTTLTDSADANLLTAINVTADVNEIEAGMIIKAAQGKTIKAVTVTTATTGVVWGLTYPTPSV